MTWKSAPRRAVSRKPKPSKLTSRGGSCTVPLSNLDVIMDLTFRLQYENGSFDDRTITKPPGADPSSSLAYWRCLELEGVTKSARVIRISRVHNGKMYDTRTVEQVFESMCANSSAFAKQWTWGPDWFDFYRPIETVY